MYSRRRSASFCNSDKVIGVIFICPQQSCYQHTSPLQVRHSPYSVLVDKNLRRIADFQCLIRDASCNVWVVPRESTAVQ